MMRIGSTIASLVLLGGSILQAQTTCSLAAPPDSVDLPVHLIVRPEEVTFDSGESRRTEKVQARLLTLFVQELRHILRLPPTLVVPPPTRYEELERLPKRSRNRRVNAVRSPNPRLRFVLTEGGQVEDFELLQPSGVAGLDSSLAWAIYEGDRLGVFADVGTTGGVVLVVGFSVAPTDRDYSVPVFQARLPAYDLRDVKALKEVLVSRRAFPAAPARTYQLLVRFDVTSEGLADTTTVITGEYGDTLATRLQRELLPQWRFRAATANGCAIPSTMVLRAFFTR